MGPLVLPAATWRERFLLHFVPACRLAATSPHGPLRTLPCRGKLPSRAALVHLSCMFYCFYTQFLPIRSLHDLIWNKGEQTIKEYSLNTKDLIKRLSKIRILLLKPRLNTLSDHLLTCFKIFSHDVFMQNVIKLRSFLGHSFCRMSKVSLSYVHTAKEATSNKYVYINTHFELRKFLRPFFWALRINCQTHVSC